LLIGPVFTREIVLTPRRPRTYIVRSAYGFALLILVITAWLVLTGTQRIRDVGDLARFGMTVFQLLAPVQLAVAVFFSALLAASAVAQEKDRRTLDLLLLTKLSNSELVLGKLLASLLHVFTPLVAALPLFMLMALLGGVSFGQIGRMLAVTVASVLACGSLGSTLALWREKTFQSLAMTMLVLVLWLAGWRAVAMGLVGPHWGGLSCQTWAAGFSPWEAILEATRPFAQSDPALGLLGTPVHLFLLAAAAMTVLLNALAIAMVRVWNPSREAQAFHREDETWHRASIWGAEYDVAQEGGGWRVAGGAESDTLSMPRATLPPPPAPHHPPPATRSREVWDNPVVWREITTWAYGRKILVIRLAYLVLVALAAGSLWWVVSHNEPVTRSVALTALVPLCLLSLVLVNAQAVTSLTSERDGRALDLLLVSDLSPKEIVYGKLGGVFYNTKEMVVLPMVLCGYLWYAKALSFENLLYLLIGLAVLYLFVAVLGIHVGMNYASSRTAIATSLGTVFFLFLGVATCMWMMIALGGSFEAQLWPFLGFILGGGVGLYVALGARNPSGAIGVAAFGCPLATFYAITSFFLDQTLGVLLVAGTAYGFATAAMLIPAICEFDVATGRTTLGE
jgi:ABC-type transport system involved in multi-copper enzyme maturation permease subunit